MCFEFWYKWAVARLSRIHVDYAVYHVLLHALDNKTIFPSAADRHQWEKWLAEGCSRFGHQLHAYCWMKDQIQLAVQVSDTPLSKLVQNLSFRYTRYRNQNRGEKGPLFRGRYKAVMIDPDQYLNELVRYIHNSPVFSGLATSADKYRWSSHNTYTGDDKKDWVTTQTVLSTFGKTERSSIARYKKYIKSGPSQGIRFDLVQGKNRGRLLGDAKFIRKALKPIKMAPKITTVDKLVGVVCLHSDIKEVALRNESRARYESRARQVITYLAIELDICNLTTMARRFNRDLTTMSRNQRYFQDCLATDVELQKDVRYLRKLIINS